MSRLTIYYAERRQNRTSVRNPVVYISIVLRIIYLTRIYDFSYNDYDSTFCTNFSASMKVHYNIIILYETVSFWNGIILFNNNNNPILLVIEKL